jgi:hypothetical protein
MLTLIALILGIIAGYLRGGRLRRLATLDLRWPWLVVASLLLQLLIFPLAPGRPIIPWGTVPLHYVSYAMALAFVARNWRIFPLLGLAVGALCNLIALVANGGRMPVSADSLRAAGAVGLAERVTAEIDLANVTLMTAETRCNALGDWLYLPSWFPGAIAFSIGDLAISVAIGVLVYWGMTRRA